MLGWPGRAVKAFIYYQPSHHQWRVAPSSPAKVLQPGEGQRIRPCGQLTMSPQHKVDSCWSRVAAQAFHPAGRI